ncbi:M23 family metallopeptidase [Longimicrobium sp.]|uniref:M23 family metallopeptidase n=1 Tax=Longimicrobium sp. TaxID=2029185 RepID=UPI002E30AA8A|nr:M23 family metallopeptidase [Longimicrobium sp.]HEX6039191.1 M23 family metallopeptidase [Longimicrobium sp.]
MTRRHTPPRRHDPPKLAVAVIAALGLAFASSAALADPQAGLPVEQASLFTLPSAHATPVHIDTLLIGGFARGTFREALATVASDLSESEREMVGRHLDKIFLPILQGRALQSGGRLKVAYERVRRPDGSTRAIQVLAAQAAVAGGLHTVFFYEHGDQPGYYDAFGSSLEERPWTGPLSHLQVTSGFRLDRMHPILRQVLPHTGIDYAATQGTPVYATADGSVSYAAVRGGYGNMVEVQHPNGYATRYAHLSRIAVRPYQGVQQGDVIGYVGSTGLATGPHLHYEVRRKGQPVDPVVATSFTTPTQTAVDYDLAWRNERRALARLLARTPTVIRLAKPI